jgi:RNA polymerase sigma factor (sigma-70 family)
MTTSNSAPAALDAAQRELAAAYFRYALSLVRELRARYGDVPADELVSAATAALVYAAARFDPARGVHFAFYLRRGVGQRVAAAVRAWRGRRYVASLSAAGDADGAALEPVDYRTPDPARQAAAYDLAAHVCRGLPPRQAEALWLLHAEGWSQEDIGDRLGVSRQLASTEATRGLRRARSMVAAG